MKKDERTKIGRKRDEKDEWAKGLIQWMHTLFHNFLIKMINELHSTLRTWRTDAVCVSSSQNRI